MSQEDFEALKKLLQQVGYDPRGPMLRAVPNTHRHTDNLRNANLQSALRLCSTVQDHIERKNLNPEITNTFPTAAQATKGVSQSTYTTKNVSAGLETTVELLIPAQATSGVSQSKYTTKNVSTNCETITALPTAAQTTRDTSQTIIIPNNVFVDLEVTAGQRSDHRTSLMEAPQTTKSNESRLDHIFISATPEDSPFSDYRNELQDFEQLARAQKKRRDSESDWVAQRQAELRSREPCSTGGQSLYGAQWVLDTNDGNYYEKKLYEVYHHIG